MPNVRRARRVKRRARSEARAEAARETVTYTTERIREETESTPRNCWKALGVRPRQNAGCGQP